MERIKGMNVNVDGVVLGEVAMPKEIHDLYEESNSLVAKISSAKRQSAIYESKLKICHIRCNQIKRKVIHSNGKMLEKGKGSGVKGTYNPDKNTMRIYDYDSYRNKPEEVTSNNITSNNSEEDVNLPEIFKNSEAFKSLT